MKKWQFYYILIISALMLVMSAGILREILKGKINIKGEIIPLSILLLFFLSSSILIFNIKKIKLNLNNLPILNNKIFIKSSIITLILLTIYFISGQIYEMTVLIKKGYKLDISPIYYIGFIIFIIYILFLVKLFIALRNLTKLKK